MSLYNLPNSTDGIDSIIVNTVTAVPSFIPMFLIFVYFVVLIGGITAQKKRTGSSDFPLWSTMASISTLIISLPLTLTVGIINVPTLAVVVIVTLLSGVWFFMSRNRYEM